MLHSAPMFISTFRRRLTAGLLIFGLLLQTLLPALAGAAVGSSERWVEVCAVSGVKWVKLDQVAGSSQHGGTADHCVLCAATGALPEFDASPYLSLPVADARPVPSFDSAVPAYSGHDLRARAPPSLS